MKAPGRLAKTRRAKVIGHFSDQDDDVALLQLIGDPAPLVAEQVAVLGSAEESFDNSFRSYGFRPLGDYPAGITDGNIQGYVDPPEGKGLHVDPVQLESRQVSGGMSGAPVLDKERNLVVGLITRAYFPDPRTTKDRDTAWAVDAYVLSLDPFNLPIRDEPLSLDRAPQPRINISAAQVAAAPDVAMVLHGAPPTPDEHIWPNDLLTALSNEWTSSEKRIVNPVSFGCEDKSSLVRLWIDRLLADSSQPQPDGVFWWSFSKNPNVDDFFGAALAFMGVGRIDLHSLPSAHTQAQLVGAMLRQRCCLFVLEGLESVQYQDEENYGLLTDDDLRELLRFFAAPGHKSFCLVITDIPVVDLIDYATYALPLLQSSRSSLVAAGWLCQQPGTFRDLAGERPFEWLASLLWTGGKGIVGQLSNHRIDDVRRRWVASQRARPHVPENFIIDRTDLESTKFLIVGETGSGGDPQFALVPPLISCGKDTQFMIICSDVYPPGSHQQYLHNFYRAYKDYLNPIYALPGNQEWYDALNSFMVHFCDAEPSGRPALGSNRILKYLWGNPKKIDPEVLEQCRAFRSEVKAHLKQPGPYFAIDTGPVRLVCIDTGLTGRLDREQGEWLGWVSHETPKPKILFTNRPIYADGEYYPGSVEDGGSIDKIVRTRENNYVAAIGGGTNNYQRYSVKVEDRSIHYIAAGGGGYTSGTHKIPEVDLPGVSEDDFRCYPLREDSLSYYSRIYDERFVMGYGLLEISPHEAASYMAKRYGIESASTRDKNAFLSRRSQKIAEWIFPLPGRGTGPLLPTFSTFFAWDPPYFNNFLHVEASKSELTIICYGVTGCREHEINPPVEDHVKVRLETLLT